MNVKTLLSFAGLVSAGYGVWFFFAPQHAAEVYGYGDLTTDLSTMILQFFAIAMLAVGVMCWMARDAAKSTGRTAVLWSLAVGQILFLYMNAKAATAGVETSINYVDILLNAVFGFGAVYFILQDRKEA